ncbi:uncharacterized protein G2W53_026884 [Senna tora]|uniref:Uncharacterized protein n=1 Tax=Senna tora TaxID=362788 RepID=A0A834TPV2_9FABA|nr:uncharacterized protein G2W53_026884 [Senna tora]
MAGYASVARHSVPHLYFSRLISPQSSLCFLSLSNKKEGMRGLGLAAFG